MSNPSWACGYPVEYLKQWADLFRDEHKPLVFGAFGLVKERDIAPALRRREVVSHWSAQEADPSRHLLGAAIWHKLKSASAHSDFRGRPIRVPAGAIVVSAFAARGYSAGQSLIRQLRNLAKDSPIMIEIFEEDLIAKSTVLTMGFDYIGTKVMAGSEIKGLYANAPLGAEPIAHEDLPSIAVLQDPFLGDQALRDIRLELEAWGDHYANHYSSYNKGKSWSALALRGFKPDDPLFIIDPAEMSKAWKIEHAEYDFHLDWTTAIDGFPRTLEVLHSQHWAMRRVRFMRLGSGGALTRHADITDRLAGTADGHNVRFHIPIVTNQEVRFSSWDHRGHRLNMYMPEGSLCYLDTRRPHACSNEGEGRIHLVVDALSDEYIRTGLSEVVMGKDTL